MLTSTTLLFSTIESELKTLDKNLKTMVTAQHPVLYAAAEHLFNAGGKRLRPAIILLMAKATSNQILDHHKRLAEITEIIHTASLVHDDVLDDCSTRRGLKTVHNTFNTKIAVLAGDFLFAQSSWYLANLDNLHVVKTISKVIIDFAEGEVQQGSNYFNHNIYVQSYMEKSFYKTASLIAASCKSAYLLNIDDPNLSNYAYNYGKYLGLAFQMIDDILDIIGTEESLGKPVGLDLKNGNLTAPILFALIEEPKLISLIDREFSQLGDLELALHLIKRSNGIQQAKDMAFEYIQAALTCLRKLGSSEAIISLKQITHYIFTRLN
uniref:Prenyl transferase n=1 Tax=Bulboplastis apyrenoidosa TaxID=1070855 RepID=A0A1Y9TME7_9RHOD|nr:prenyl transferase [Bulboplastis apyrenoidosa]ARO90830.1 prenyl transferase [Bulboplastis apyrenoidosa]